MTLRLGCTAREASRLLASLLVLDLTFFVLYVVIHILGADRTWGPVRPFFDLASDVSIPAWFSAIQLFVTGCTLQIAGANQRRPARVPPRLMTAGAAGFVFLSADESARIHERVTAVARMLELDWLLISGHGAWIPVYLVVAVVAGLMAAPYLPALWRHLRRETLIAAGGALVVVSGAVGLEVAGYFLIRESTEYRIQVAFEELFEMSGVSIILYAVVLMNLRLAGETEARGVPRDTEAAL